MAAAGAPAPAPVHVTRERVVAPPERFISLSDGLLLQFFQGALGAAGVLPAGPGRAGELSTLFSMLEGICQHEFLSLRRRLEANFAFFTAGGQGTHTDKGKPLRLSAIEEVERRFLGDFIAAMQASHYRLLSPCEWEAALAEAFLFTLPVTVDWSALDKRMLQRFWGDLPEERRQLPDLSDRILIFHRGFEPAKMRGRYLMQKIELLISFYLLTPLWAALVTLLEKVGLKAPPPPPMAHVHHKPEVTFRTVGTAARVAMKWRRAAQGELEGDDSLMHDACTIIERKTMSRHFPTGRSVLARFFDVIELQEACFQDVVVLYRRKASKEWRAEGEKEIIRDTDPRLQGRNINIRHYSGIPLADLEMVMPEKKVFVPPSVFLQLVVAVLLAAGGLLATFFEAHLDWKVWGSALMLLASRASQVYFQAASERNEIEREMNKLLSERTLASQDSVLRSLTDEMCRQHIRELFLCYCCLLTSGKDMTDDDLDTRCERLLRKHFGLRLDFTAEKAIPTLCDWGLVCRQADGRLRAQPLPAALVALDNVWDGFFDFAGQGSSAGRSRADSGAASNAPASSVKRRDVGGQASCQPACSGSTMAAGSTGPAGRNVQGDLLQEQPPPQPQQSDDEPAAGLQDNPWPAPAGAASECAPVGSAGVDSTEAFQVLQPGEFPLSACSVMEASRPAASGSVASSCGEQAGGSSAVAVAVAIAVAEAEAEAEAEASGCEAEVLPGLASEPSFGQASSVSVEQEAEGEQGVAGEEPACVEQDGSTGSAVAGLEAEASQVEFDAVEEEAARGEGGGEEAVAAAGHEESGGEEGAQAQGEGLLAASSSSSSSLEYVALRVPPTTMAAPTLARPPSSKLSSRQLRHLESLRWQRQQQEAEALECLPSALRLRTGKAAAPKAPKATPALDSQLTSAQQGPGRAAAAGAQAKQGSPDTAAAAGRLKRAQGSPRSESRVAAACVLAQRSSPSSRCRSTRPLA